MDRDDTDILSVPVDAVVLRVRRPGLEVRAAPCVRGCPGTARRGIGEVRREVRLHRLADAVVVRLARSCHVALRGRDDGLWSRETATEDEC